MVVYLAGPIRSVKNYKKVFSAWESKLTGAGYKVLNPATLPLGMSDRAYMPICLQMIEQADIVAFMPGWENSSGCQLERAYAEYQGKELRCL